RGAQTTREHSDGRRSMEDVMSPQSKGPQAQPSSLPSPRATPPPHAECQQKLTHPLHTFRLKTLCSNCREARDARIETFEAQMRQDLEQRILTRSARNTGGSVFGRRRLFRAPTALAM